MSDVPDSRQVVIEGVRLHLSAPVETKQEWIGQTETLRGLLACWLVLDESDLPLSPRVSVQSRTVGSVV